jgi:RimJ/RimL family protein N-acetyltransferase
MQKPSQKYTHLKKSEINCSSTVLPLTHEMLILTLSTLEIVASSFNTISETQEYFKAVHNTPGRLMYSIYLRPNEDASNEAKLIGLIGLNKYNRFTYLLHPSYWGAGYATEAVRGARTRLFEEQPERKILMAGIHKGNIGSQQVLVKCGFEEVETTGIMLKAMGRRLEESEEKEVLRVMESKKDVTNVTEAGKKEERLDSDTDIEGSPYTWYCYVKP